VEKIKLTCGELTPVTGLMIVPHDVSEKLPAVLYVDGRGKKTDAGAGDIIEKIYTDSGKIVFAVDVRGFGETKDNPGKNESKHENNEHRNAVISAYVGKTLIGQRVQDITMAKEYLMGREEVDTAGISIVGIDRAGTSVLHAAALDGDFKEIVIRLWSDTSWTTMVESPTVKNNLTHVVPSALKYYDLPDLVEAASPRPVTYAVEPVISTAVIEMAGQQKGTLLGQNYPNPFSHSTTIIYRLPSAGKVSLKVYNSQGREVAVLVDRYQEADRYEIQWNGKLPGTGIFYYRLSLDGEELETRKMSSVRY
jgi:hypothetical protein